MIIFCHLIWTHCPYPHFLVPIHRPAAKQQVFSTEELGTSLTIVQDLVVTNELPLLLFKRVGKSKFYIVDSK